MKVSLKILNSGLILKTFTHALYISMGHSMHLGLRVTSMQRVNGHLIRYLHFTSCRHQ